MPTFRRWLLALFPVHTRRGLLLVTLTLQALILSVGLLVVFNDIRTRVALRLQDRIIEQNIKTAESLAKTMDELDFGPAYCGSVGRERAQKLIEELQLPAGGFVCLLDDKDQIICHPRLREDPTLCGINLRELKVTETSEQNVVLGEADRAKVVAGRAQFMDKGTHFLAAKYIPSMQARVVVQQPISGLLAFGEAVASGSMIRAAGLGAVALALTGAVSFVLIRRHNRTLEHINAGLEMEVSMRVHECLTARHALIIGLAKLAESRDTDTGEHLERIALYCDLLARELVSEFPEITTEWMAHMRLASTLHDIGKVGIPDSVLLKPGKLMPEERAIMERHPIIGAETLSTVGDRMGDDQLIRMSIDIARSHHEKFDGTGYPDRLAGEAIPLSARIVALADVYDALTSARVYKAAMPHAKAKEIILQGRGTHFDARIVAAFERVAAEFDRVRESMQPKAPMRLIETPAASLAA